MNLFFDHFRTMKQAEAFLAAVKAEVGLDGRAYEDVEKEHADVPGCFPFVCIYVSLHAKEAQAAISLVGSYGGIFSGT